MLHRGFRRDVQLQLLLILAGIAFLLFALVDPFIRTGWVLGLAPNLILSALAVILVVASLLSARVRAALPGLFILYTVSATTFLLVTAYRSGFAVPQTLSVFVAVTIISIVFDDARNVALFSVATTVITAVLYRLAVEPAVDARVFFPLLIATELAAFWNVRSRNLAERELAAAVAAAEKANAAKSEFLANMSHEIRTPVTGIVGLTDLLLEQEPREDQTEYLETLQRSGMVLLSLINDLLDLSTMQTAATGLNHQPLDLHRLVETVINLHIREFGRQGLVLGFEIAADVPVTVRSDSHRLQQIFNNLLSNAAKFTNSGGAHLRITHAADALLEQHAIDREDGRDYLHVIVRDTGIGIAESEIPKLFHDSVQLDSSYAKTHPGAGLGLAICRQIVDLFGGVIWIESELGKGSSAHVVIPVEPGVESDIEADRAKDAPRVLRVLVADSNQANAILCARMLERHRHLVEIAETGPGALGTYRARRFDLVLLDTRLPELSGEELVQIIRSEESAGGGRTVLICMSSRAGEQERRLFVDAGADECLTKPISAGQLYQAIDRHVGQER